MQDYSIYELFYEYHDKRERDLASEEHVELITDKIEAEEERDTLDWIEEEERKEKEAEEMARAKAEKADEEWMLKELKKEHGDDFGEDLGLDFSE